MEYSHLRRSDQVEDRRKNNPLREVLGALYGQSQAAYENMVDPSLELHYTQPPADLDPRLALARALGIDDVGMGAFVREMSLLDPNPWGI